MFCFDSLIHAIESFDRLFCKKYFSLSFFSLELFELLERLIQDRMKPSDWSHSLAAASVASQHVADDTDAQSVFP